MFLFLVLMSWAIHLDSRGLSEGVEAFFYEPYQGAIQGPEEFIEGMALGLKALVGGAVGRFQHYHSSILISKQGKYL